MIFIREIGCYIPPKNISNLKRANSFDVDETFIQEKIGVNKIAQMVKGEDTSDLCVKSFYNLKQIVDLELVDIDCLVVCTQNPDKNGIPHTSAIVHSKLELPEDCACFDISLGCSGYVYALSILKGFMETNGFSKGLLFTADPYSKIIDDQDKNTALLFGDAGTVTLLEDDPNAALKLEKFCLATKGKGGAALHNDKGSLYMNGRAIFNFAITQVPDQIEKLKQKCHINDDQIDLYLFHQGSKFIIDQLCNKMALDPNKVPMGLAKQGNTVSSTIPLLLKDVIGQKDINNIILSGFGVGLSWGSCLLTRN